MGSFYVSVCVSDLATDQLVKWLNQIDDRFLVGPQVDNWACFVSEQLDRQDFALLDGFGKALTRESERRALVVLNHDDSVLSLDVYSNGVMIGGYNSCPGYFSDDPTEAQLRPRLRNPEAYSSLKVGVTVEQVSLILAPDEPYVFPSEAHSSLVDLLGLPSYSKCVGYNYVLLGETDVTWVAAGKQA